jgi:hypothetical protein
LGVRWQFLWVLAVIVSEKLAAVGLDVGVVVSTPHSVAIVVNGTA